MTNSSKNSRLWLPLVSLVTLMMTRLSKVLKSLNVNSIVSWATLNLVRTKVPLVFWVATALVMLVISLNPLSSLVSR